MLQQQLCLYGIKAEDNQVRRFLLLFRMEETLACWQAEGRWQVKRELKIREEVVQGAKC